MGGSILLAMVLAGGTVAAPVTATRLTDALAVEWMSAWEQSITGGVARDRHAWNEMGEELGWLVSPSLTGCYQGWRATGDERWIKRLLEWSDAWMDRAVIEPDGFPGWPKRGSGSAFEQAHLNDSLPGEAMALRPAVLMAAEILKSPALRERHGKKAEAHLALAERVFEKWDARGAWREVAGGGLWVVPEFGITRTGDGWTVAWTDGWATRTVTGFSHPANKQNAIANWMIALADATGKPVYRDRAGKWWRLMKARLKPRGNGKHLTWSYWEPGGAWDSNPDGTLKHRVGVHPNGGYYAIDVEGMVSAYEHGLVFTKAELDRLVATNRDFMWNRKVVGAKFRRIDGGKPDPRWPDTAGVLWTALLPYDATLRKIFEATHQPDGWSGLALTPWYLALRKSTGSRKAGRPEP